MAFSIDIENLFVTRGEFSLEVDELRIRVGEVFAILGTTGSGKTVLMESIAGAYPIDSGKICFNGRDLANWPVQDRRLGILYQDYALFPHMSVRENVAYGLRRARPKCSDITERVDEMLALFKIEHLADRYPGVISGGESQRVALARALVLEPEVLILDEPFSALDPTTKRSMYEMLRELHAKFGCTIVFVTHDFHEAQTLADRIGIVLDGRLRCVADASNLFDEAHDPKVKRFLGMQETCEKEQAK